MSQLIAKIWGSIVAMSRGLCVVTFNGFTTQLIQTTIQAVFELWGGDEDVVVPEGAWSSTSMPASCICCKN